MGKIKVVQIAVAASTDDTWEIQYLDDKGRVWYEETRRTGDGGNYPYEYHKTWKQVELPEEPNE